MEDEKYVYLQDIKEKKATGRSAHNAGKAHRGAVRFPSDFMTRKEKNAMNGEVKSYKLNSPMTWVEFKAMPDDLKQNYITLLRKHYNVPDSVIARELFSLHKVTFSNEMKRLGLSKGRTTNKKYKVDEWAAWLNRGAAPAAEVEESLLVVEEPEPMAEEQIAPPVYATTIPHSGKLIFCGNMVESLHTALLLLEGAKGEITISWECDPVG